MFVVKFGMKPFVRIIIVSIIYLTFSISLFSSYSFAEQTQTIHVLFIGNSLISVNNLPDIISNLSKFYHLQIDYDQYTPGGYKLSQHAVDEQVLKKINRGIWDYVVLQEQSQMLSFGENQCTQYVYPYAKKLTDMIRRANPKAHVVFYMTMAWKNGDPNFLMPPKQRYEPPWSSSSSTMHWEWDTFERMQQRIIVSYRDVAAQNHALLAPVGEVWRSVRQKLPSLKLYTDERHPNLTGSYLAACVLLKVFSHGQSVVGLPFPKTIDKQTAQLIQQQTDELVDLTYSHYSWETRL